MAGPDPCGGLDYLTPEQHRRLAVVLAVTRSGGQQGFAAQRLGLTSGGMRSFLTRMGFTLGWPVDAVLLGQLVALPVVAAAPARKAARRQRRPAEEFGWHRADGVRIPQAEVDARRAAAEQSRAEYEQRMLRAEQRRYGLPRCGRALSSMVL